MLHSLKFLLNVWKSVITHSFCLSSSLKDTVVSYMERKDLDIPPEVDEFFPKEILLSQYTNTWKFSVHVRQERNQRWSASVVLPNHSYQGKLSFDLQMPYFLEQLLITDFQKQCLLCTWVTVCSTAQWGTVFCCIYSTVYCHGTIFQISL